MMVTALVQCPYSGRGSARCSGAFLHVVQTFFRARRPTRRFEPASPLMCAERPRLIERRAQIRQFPAMRPRNVLQIVEVDVVVTGVVIATYEPGVVGDHHTALPQASADSRMIGHGSEQASVGAAAPATHTPQSYADSCGLFRLVDPCPNVTTKRAIPLRNPAMVRTAATRSTFSSTVNPFSRSKVS